MCHTNTHTLTTSQLTMALKYMHKNFKAITKVTLFFSKIGKGYLLCR